MEAKISVLSGYDNFGLNLQSSQHLELMRRPVFMQRDPKHFRWRAPKIYSVSGNSLDA
jgi:hypothetical protein